jgi:uroporphyrinogen decarboxylase
MKKKPLSKIEVIKAIEKKNPTHIPGWYSWIADETWEKYGNELKLLLDNYSDDIILVDYDMPEDFVAPAEGRDEWGIYYINIPGVFSGMRSSDLKEGGWDAVEGKLIKNFPDPYAKGRFERVKKYRDQHPDLYLVGHWWATFFERFIALFKEQDFLVDIYLNKKKVEKLGGMICDFFCGIIDGFGKCGMDGIFFSDDLGFTNQLIIQPDLFRELFKPWYKKLFDRIHKYNMHVIMHSCGYLWEIIPDLIDIGMDVHHFQPSAMDMKRYVKEFGKDLTFFGGIDIQKFLIKSTPNEVREGIKEIFSLLDHDGGGYMSGPSNTIMPDTPFENIVAMFEAMSYYADRKSF